MFSGQKGQKVFTPDFLFVQEDRRKVLLEIVGFRAPAFLAQKLKTLALFKDSTIIVAVEEKAAAQFQDSGSPVRHL